MPGGLTPFIVWMRQPSPGRENRSGKSEPAPCRGCLSLSAEACPIPSPCPTPLPAALNLSAPLLTSLLPLSFSKPSRQTGRCGGNGRQGLGAPLLLTVWLAGRKQQPLRPPGFAMPRNVEEQVFSLSTQPPSGPRLSRSSPSGPPLSSTCFALPCSRPVTCGGGGCHIPLPCNLIHKLTA